MATRKPLGESYKIGGQGSGAKRALGGYAPGAYLVRAATLRAKERSAWFGPVVVIVK